MRPFLESLRSNDGITMVEMMLALVIGAVILTAGAAALAASMSGVGAARANQQSAELLSEIIEETRSVDYSSVMQKLDPAALTGDSRVTTAGGDYYVDPDGSGSLAPERLILSPTGTVPVSRTLERNGTVYTVATYVTVPSSADADYRRVSTFVTWTRNAKTHTRQASTFVAATRRGLPLPSFTVGNPITAPVNAGAKLVLPVEIMNNGARDAWNMGVTTSPQSAWSFTFIADTDGNDVLDATDVALSDSDGNGSPDTGLLETDQVKTMWAVADVPSTDPAGSVSVSIVATSSSDPTVAKSVIHTVNVLAQACASCTLTPYYLVNATGAPVNSTLKPVMPMSLTPGAAYAGVPNYDTDKDSWQGRTVKLGGTTMMEGDATRLALWEMQVNNGQLTMSGTATLSLWVAPNSVEASKTATVRVFIARRHGANVTQIATADRSFSFPGPGFARLDVEVPVPYMEIANNRYLQVRVVLPDGEHNKLLLGYGTAGAPAAIIVPKV